MERWIIWLIPINGINSHFFWRELKQENCVVSLCYRNMLLTKYQRILSQWSSLFSFCNVQLSFFAFNELLTTLVSQDLTTYCAFVESVYKHKRSKVNDHVVDIYKTKTKRNQNKYIIYSRLSILVSFRTRIENIFSKTTEIILIKS